MFDYVIDNIREHLHGALDACAPDRSNWIAGEATFWTTLMEGMSIEDAISNALDACAPDGNSWIKGWRVFNARWAFDGFLRLRELNYNLFRDKSNT